MTQINSENWSGDVSRACWTVEDPARLHEGQTLLRTERFVVRWLRILPNKCEHVDLRAFHNTDITQAAEPNQK